MTNFINEVLKLPSDRICIQNDPGIWNLPIGDIYLGVPESKSFGWSSVDHVPLNTTGFKFLVGSDHERLIEEFTKSEFVSNVERLVIGTSTFGNGNKRNYENITEILSEIKFPKLKYFQLGTCVMYSNSMSVNGKVGNVTKLLKNMPNLDDLTLSGVFVLDDIPSLSKLKCLWVEYADELNPKSYEKISQQSLDKIFAAELPELSELIVNMECNYLSCPQEYYTFVEKFVTGLSFPKLRKIDISGTFKEGEFEKVSNGIVGKRSDLRLILTPFGE